MRRNLQLRYRSCRPWRVGTALLRLNFQNLPSPSNKPTTNATPHPSQRQLTLPSHSPKPQCHLYALMLIDDTRGQLPPGWVPHAVAGVSAVPTIDDIHRHAWFSRSNTMAIYDDVINMPLGGWIQRLVWCPTGDCSGGFRKRSTTATPQSYCSAVAHRGPSKQQRI